MIKHLLYRAESRYSSQNLLSFSRGLKMKHSAKRGDQLTWKPHSDPLRP